MKNRINKNNQSDINDFIIKAFNKRAIVRGDNTVSPVDQFKVESAIAEKWNLSENAAIQAVQQMLHMSYPLRRWKIK